MCVCVCVCLCVCVRVCVCVCVCVLCIIMCTYIHAVHTYMLYIRTCCTYIHPVQATTLSFMYQYGNPAFCNAEAGYYLTTSQVAMNFIMALTPDQLSFTKLVVCVCVYVCLQ